MHIVREELSKDTKDYAEAARKSLRQSIDISINRERCKEFYRELDHIFARLRDGAR